MDPKLKRLFLKHIDEQIRFFMLALEDIRDGELVIDRQKPETEDRFWYGVQSAILAVGNVSKVLWGSKGRYADQRAELREFLGISDDSPLRDTAMRNHWEHLDERIDTWYETGEPFIHDRVYAGVSAYPFGKSLFRWFERHSLVVSFWGDSWNLFEMADELVRIQLIIDDYPLSGWYPLEEE